MGLPPHSSPSYSTGVPHGRHEEDSRVSFPPPPTSVGPKTSKTSMEQENVDDSKPRALPQITPGTISKAPSKPTPSSVLKTQLPQVETPTATLKPAPVAASQDSDAKQESPSASKSPARVESPFRRAKQEERAEPGKSVAPLTAAIPRKKRKTAPGDQEQQPRLFEYSSLSSDGQSPYLFGPTSGVADFPKKIAINIFGHLSRDDLNKCSLVCKSWRETTRHEELSRLS